MTNIVDSIREDVESNLDFTMSYCPPGFYNTGFSVFVRVFWWVSSQCSFLELCCSKRLTEATRFTDSSDDNQLFLRRRHIQKPTTLQQPCVYVCVGERDNILCLYCVETPRTSQDPGACVYVWAWHDRTGLSGWVTVLRTTHGLVS